MSEPQTQSTALVFNDDSAFTRALKLAETMATAKTLPKHLQDSPGDCLRVVELAMRTNQSPFALADKTFLVGGKISFEGQLCAALLNANPILATRLKYDYDGDPAKPETLSVIVSATVRGESEPRSVVCYWAAGHDQSPSNKTLWKKQPEQQLAYWGARVWGRRHAPEVLMGIYTPDEIEAELCERPVTGRIIEESDKPALPPRQKTKEAIPLSSAAEAEVWDSGAREQTLEPVPWTDYHDSLLEALDSIDVTNEDFLAFVNATGKSVPDGGYNAIAEMPESVVSATLGAWENISKKLVDWLANQP